MADDKTIKLLVSLGLDKAAAKDVKAGVLSVDEAIKKLAKNTEATAADLKQAFETVAKSGKYSVKQLDSATLELNASLKLLQKTGAYAIDPLKNDLDDATKKTGGLTNNFNGMIGKLAAAGALYAAGTWAKDFAVDSYNAAAAAERLGNATDNLGKRFGVSGQQITESIQKASGGTISQVDAMKSANQAMLLGVVESEDQFAKLAEMAVVLGRAMGQDAGKSIEDISVGIGRQSKLILDNLGIVVDTDKVYQDYAASISKTADALTDQEKKTAFTNAVMEQGAKKAAELGGVIDDTAAKTEKLTSSWSDFQVEFGKLLGDAGLLDLLNGVVGGLLEGAKAWQEVFEQAKMMKQAANPLVEEAKVMAREGDTTAQKVAGAMVEIADMLPISSGVMRIGANILMPEETAAGYQALAEEAEKAEVAQKKSNEATEETTEDTEAAKEAADAYADALAKIADANRNLETDTRRKQVDAEKDNLRDLAKMELDFQRERADLELKYGRELLDAAEDLADERVDIARQSVQEIADIERQYAQDVADAGGDYRSDLTQIDRDLANERLSIERDYQSRLADIRREFEQSAEEAVRNNDAIAFLRAQRQRDDSLQDAQIDRDQRLEEAAITAQQEREQRQQERQQELDELREKYERELEEQKIATERKLEEAQIENQRKLEELKQAYALELADQTTSEARKRADLQTAYAQKLQDLRTYYNQRLADTRAALQAEYALVAQYTAQIQQAQSAGVSSAGGANYSGWQAPTSGGTSQPYRSPSIYGYAAGGYATNGIFRLGEAGQEFVMNAAVTRQMEQALGGRITSGGLATLANNASMSNTFNFSERDDAKMIMSQVSQIIDSKLTRLERGY